ncbi:MAG: hypothetical protein IJ225_11155 [Solobacterium sp.]|nr:hypothetical protein [Solobacterium sp.]
MATSKTKTKTPSQSTRSSGSGSTVKKSSAKRKKAKASTGTKVLFWIVLIIFLIPFLVMGYILLSAMMDQGKPVIGSRYDNDHDPAITSAEVSEVESAVKGVSGVESSFANLATGTLRVYADISDSASAESAENTARTIYNKVTGVLNPSVYFSQNNGMKMYDLEIHVYNQNKDSDSNFVYVIATRTSSMSEPIYQLVSEPIDGELAESLRQAVENRNNPTPTPDELTVGDGDVEELPDDTEPQPEEVQEDTDEG